MYIYTKITKTVAYTNTLMAPSHLEMVKVFPMHI